MKISSKDFLNDGLIPEKFTCKGENINPELTFENIPKSAVSLVLIMDDPDAPNGTFTHWVVWNIPPGIKEFPQNISDVPGIQAKNGRGENKYTGPCPPSGTHRYYFKLYALDLVFPADQIKTKENLVAEMAGHILEQTELMGKFAK